VIDMQAGMIPVLWQGAQLVERIGELISAARKAEVPVIAIQQTGPPGSPFDPVSPGWRLDARLGVGEGDLRIQKSATDSFFGTELGDVLSARGITTVIVVGAATDFCVDATVRAAVSRGLNVDLVSDGHTTASNGDPDAELNPEQIIAHHNRILSQAIHPGGHVHLIKAAEVFSDHHCANGARFSE
jgi:nicotinamidase-related amidase